MSKATHEFLTLHYFALDSAEWWERILGELLPNAQFPDAVVRRTIAYKMFMAVHIAPSHRRPPHPVWEDSLCLIADLLFGNGMDRYVGAMQGPDSPVEVNVRGFSAGSYAGLAFLHILWSIPRVTTKGCLGAIACPPSLLNMSRAKEEDQLHLIHFESDRLCSWKPGPQQMRDCCTSFTYITNEIASYKGHFGPDEHDYSHWMALNLPNGSIALRVLLFIRPEAASKAKRDATPLRLISWLSYKLNPELEQFIEQAMEHLSTWKETEGGKVLTVVKDTACWSEGVREQLVYEAEVLPYSVALYVWHSYIRDSCLFVYIDNEASRFSWIAGTADRGLVQHMIHRALCLESDLSTYPYFNRVPSHSNLADDPSRGRFAFLQSCGCVRDSMPHGVLWKLYECG